MGAFVSRGSRPAPKPPDQPFSSVITTKDAGKPVKSRVVYRAKIRTGLASSALLSILWLRLHERHRLEGTLTNSELPDRETLATP